MTTLYYPSWPEKGKSLTAEESMKLVREDYEKRNNKLMKEQKYYH